MSSSVTLHMCSWCKKSLGFTSGVHSDPPERHHGVCVELGYSIGGWGFRQNFMQGSWGHVCDECFKVYAEAAGQLKATIDARQGINDPRKTIAKALELPASDPVKTEGEK